MILVLMGVSGSGKTTIGTLLAQRTGWTFADADDYHPLANKQKMASGQPLNDDDRAPWLKILNTLILKWQAEGTGGILACSALKASYRDTLASGVTPGTIHFVFLDGSEELIAQRLAGRSHEFMNPKLLQSQMATLERPQGAIHVSIDQPEEKIVEQVLASISQVGK
jgi:gluconokinase